LPEGLSGDAVLESTQGRRGSQIIVFFSKDFEYFVLAESIVIVEILVPQGDPIYTLSEHGENGVRGLLWIAWIQNAIRKGSSKAEVSVCFPEKKGPGVRSDGPTLKVADQSPPKNPSELEPVGSTMCHKVGLQSVVLN
jgi:hypothetical protein